MRGRRLGSLVSLVLLLGTAGCGLIPFEDVQTSGLRGASPAGLAWADYDNDGRLDLAIAGLDLPGPPSATAIYHNAGFGTFTPPPAGVTEVDHAELAWGDYDNDGKVDLLVSGLAPGTGAPTTQLYRNLGGGAFAPIATGLPGVGNNTTSDVAWADYDNDGRLDVALAGATASSGVITQVWRNAGGGVFTNSGASITGLSTASLAWGDYDNDGRVDLAIMGSTSTTGNWGFYTEIYRNMGGGVFTPIFSGIEALMSGALAWGDYDNDGDLDLAIVGNHGFPLHARIYRNQAGTFTDIQAGLTGFDFASLAWGDYDNDGRPDLAITGRNDNNVVALPLTQVYRNQGSSAFLAIPAPLGIINTRYGAIAWGDQDADGHLDLGVVGVYSDQMTRHLIAAVYRNRNVNGVLPNAPPSAPTNVAASTSAGTIHVTWTPATDPQTPSPGLSYNLRVGTTPTDDSRYPSMASATGLRRIAAPGLVRHDPAKPALLQLPSGSYWVSIQAIDTSLAGGPWSAAVPFTVP